MKLMLERGEVVEATIPAPLLPSQLEQRWCSCLCEIVPENLRAEGVGKYRVKKVDSEKRSKYAERRASLSLK